MYTSWYTLETPNTYNRVYYTYADLYEGSAEAIFLDNSAAGVFAIRPVIDVPKTRITDSTDDPAPISKYTITYADGTKESVDAGTVITIPENKSTKENTKVSTVTFKPENGGTDILRYVETKYTPNGYLIDTVNYQSGATYTVNSDITLSYDYTDQVVGVVFPTVSRGGYNFGGWYTMPNGEGIYRTSYNGTEDLTLYANWYESGSGIHVLPENNIAKDDTNLAVVTFKYNDNVTPDYISYVKTSYIPNGWLVDGTHYNDGEEIIKTDETVIEPDYIETVVPATFPTNPTREGFTFAGWIKDAVFDQYGTQIRIASYDGEDDITLYAAWATESGYHLITYDDGEVEAVAHGTVITVPEKNTYETETLTFTYTAGTYDDVHDEWSNIHSETFTEDYGSEVTVSKYVIDSTNYVPGSTFTVNTDLYVTREYNALTYDETEFTVPTDAYRFTGWFSEAEGGIQLRNYKNYKENNLTSGNIYGHSTEEGYYVVVLDGVEVGTFAYGSSYTLPNGVDIDEDIATVTFVNGNSTTTQKVHQTKEFVLYEIRFGDYYADEALTYNEGEVLTIEGNTYITSGYSNEEITPVTITDLADTEYEEFIGWYTKANGQGAKLTGEYEDKVDITLYAYFKGKQAEYSFYDAQNESNLGFLFGTYGEQIDTSSIVSNNTFASSHTITYRMQNGKPSDDQVSPMDATYKIDHWIDPLTNKTYAIVHTVDFVGPKSLDAVFTNEVVPHVNLITPNANIYPGYDFAGWYTLPVGGKLLESKDINEDKDYVVYAHWKRNDTNVCTFDDGHTEVCEENTTKTVPEKVNSIIAYVYEVINGTDEDYYDEIYDYHTITETKEVEYYEVDGIKYYPGNSYKVGENPTINVKYSDTYTNTVTLTENIDTDSTYNYFEDGEERVFDGWYTERTGGDRVFTYSGNETKEFYAHWREYDPEEETYTLTIEKLDGSLTTYEGLKNGAKIKLYQDVYVNRDHKTKLYDSDGTTLLANATVKFTHTADKYLVGGELYNVGREITIHKNTYIKAYETSSSRELLGYREPDSADFIGYFTTIEGGTKLDFNTIKESDAIIENAYAHYNGDVPDGYVTIDFDGDRYNVPEGTEITLPTTRDKASTSIDVTFNFAQNNISSYKGSIITSYTLTGYVVNNVIKNPGEVVVADRNLTIRTNYSESKEYDNNTRVQYSATYPNIPTFDFLDPQPLAWVSSMMTMNVIEDLSEITDNTEIYAVYTEKARVYLNDEIIDFVDVGSNYKLPINTLLKDSDTIATVTFNHKDANNTVTTSSSYKIYTPNGWTISGVDYNNGATIVVNEDITLIPKYKESITISLSSILS